MLPALSTECLGFSQEADLMTNVVHAIWKSVADVQRKAWPDPGKLQFKHTVRPMQGMTPTRAMSDSDDDDPEQRETDVSMDSFPAAPNDSPAGIGRRCPRDQILYI